MTRKQNANRLRQKTKLKAKKGRTLSSTKWLQRQLNDVLVRQAQQDGYRSRAAYKLLEMDDRFGLLGQAKVILDLGAAPGSWLQVASQRAPKNAILVGLDLVPIVPLKDVAFLQMDFLDEATPKRILDKTHQKKCDLILSDLAPSLMGHSATDHLRAMALSEAVGDFAIKHLAQEGALCVKCFQGAEDRDFELVLREHFHQVKRVKPKASRKASPEFYFIALRKR